ncbi:hypothetical protein EBS02_09550 [bacterium]|nr:hypothetical protein [bacterium]
MIIAQVLTFYQIQGPLKFESFKNLANQNILSLIYKENNDECNMMIFDVKKAISEVKFITKEETSGNRKHPVYKFLDAGRNYIFEVRYGGSKANALQRGVWTHTKHADGYFRSLTDGWVSYNKSEELLELMGKVLVSSNNSHKKILDILNEDILNLKSSLVV